MRKWMNERLKRRKKTGDETTKEPTKAQEPLQPRFYDNESAAETAPAAVKNDKAESRRPSRAQPEIESKPAVEALAEPAMESAEGEANPRTPRRRRSRGGRGGSRQRSRPGVSAATTERAAEASPSAEESAATPEAAVSEAAVTAAIPAEAAAGQSAPAQTAPIAAAAGKSAPVQTATPTGRPSKGTVVLAIGLPGSGKSSWFKRHSIHPLSSDLLRELLFDDAQEQRFQDLVFSNLRSMLKARLIARRPMNYVDATNLTPHDRHSWIKLAKDYGYDVQGVFFDVPLEICLERHQRRGRAVPEDVMRKMAGKLKAPTFEEGFSKITVVRVKQKEEAAGSAGKDEAAGVSKESAE
jgi:predicted kinase